MVGGTETSTGAKDSPAAASDFGVLASVRSVAGLHTAIRRAFTTDAEAPLEAALAAIGRHFGGVYVAFQAEIEAVHYAADWSWEGFASIEGLRESLGTSIVDVMSARRARLMPVAGEASPTILAVPVHGAGTDVIGAACAVVGPYEPADAAELLAVFEGVIGYLALHVSSGSGAAGDRALRLSFPDGVEARADDPLFLAYAMAAELRNRRGLEQVCIGFVHRGSVRVAAVCGIDDVRPSNPGVKLVAAAMEECLDRGAPVLFPAPGERQHLHAEWSRRSSGNAVASFPLEHDGRTVAIVSVKTDAEKGLTVGDVIGFQRDVQPFAWLLPVSRLASRSLVSHAAARLASGLQRVFGPKSFKRRVGLVCAAALLCWVAFGTVPYSFTVPCAVIPAEPRTIACPREGLLQELFVRPGDRVRRGQVLARLDTEDERLEEASIVADLRRLTALIDRARAEGEPGEVQVHTAQRAASQAQLDLVRLRIERSEIRAPADGRVLSGDLDRVVGAKIGMGQPLFQIAHGDRVQVELRIPENHVWDARELEVATFAPSARPTERFVLDGVAIHPTSSAAGGENFFIARSTSFRPPRHLTPGMEGVVHVEIGNRSVWWVLTHRITDWMHLRFWL